MVTRYHGLLLQTSFQLLCLPFQYTLYSPYKEYVRDKIGWWQGFWAGKGKAVPLQAWSGPEGSFIVKVKQSRYRPGVAQRVPL
jgi:hypothetical protein